MIIWLTSHMVLFAPIGWAWQEYRDRWQIYKRLFSEKTTRLPLGNFALKQLTKDVNSADVWDLFWCLWKPWQWKRIHALIIKLIFISENQNASPVRDSSIAMFRALSVQSSSWRFTPPFEGDPTIVQPPWMMLSFWTMKYLKCTTPDDKIYHL